MRDKTHDTPLTTSSRRGLLRMAAGGALASATGAALAQATDFRPGDFRTSPRYPDPAVQSLDPSFIKYRLYASGVEQLATGMRWLEGPAWFGDGRFVLFSDIPNNRMMRYDDITGQTTVFRANVGHSNAIGRDKQGRIIACEHQGRRLSRMAHDGTVTALADRFDGKPLNSPNDLAVKSDGSVWFTDPPFGIAGEYEGDKAKAEQPHGVYRVEPGTDKLVRVLDDLLFPNGIAFTPDEKQIYIVGRHAHTQNVRTLFRFDVGGNGRLSNRTEVFSGGTAGMLDSFKVDEDGNIWLGYGSATNAPGALSADMDGVIVVNPAGKQIGHIHLPERCANLCFGGPKRNRLFMAASHSLYALYVETRGAA